MDASIFEDMKSYVGFDATDEANLRSLADCIGPYVPAIVDRFYEQVFAHPEAKQVFINADRDVSRVRALLAEWLVELFGGTYDRSYYRKRSSIGAVHVRVGLPQRYMVTAMEVIRQELKRAFQEAAVADLPGKMRSVHKLLTLELGLMLEGYKERYAAQVQQKERSAFEEKLTRAEHLAQIGQLAASLAHEIKNPLAGISGAIQIIRDAMEPGHAHRAIINEILAQISRLDAVVKDLLVYARPVPPRLAPTDLNAIVQRVLKTMAREKAPHRGVRFELCCADEHAPIQADEVKVEQLLLNLLLNAAQASPHGTTVRVTTSINGDWVTLDIQDQGHGMDEAVRQRAFEPFYTTKARGTGLGLPICKRIVDAHAGSIVLRSVVGQGTRVTVELPKVHAPRP